MPQHDIDITTMSFSADTRVAKGDTVRWTNKMGILAAWPVQCAAGRRYSSLRPHWRRGRFRLLARRISLRRLRLPHHQPARPLTARIR